MKFSERHLLPLLPGVYKFTNLITKRVYIGKSICLRKRIASHVAPSTLKASEERITRSIKKYGKENFEVSLLEVYPARTPLVENLILHREAFWIAIYDATNRDKGYNSLKFHTDRTGSKATEETKRKMRESSSGEKNHQYGKRGEKSPNWGRKFPPSFGKASSERQKGKIIPMHVREKLAKSATGKRCSTRHIPVNQIDPKTEEVIKTWECLSDAAKAVIGVAKRQFNIAFAASGNNKNGTRRLCAGFFWEFAKKA